MRINRIRRLFAAIAVLGLSTGAPALAESRIERNLKLAPGGQFVLDSDVGNVTVTGTSESGARVVITSSRHDLESLFTFSFEESAGMARVTARKRHMFGWLKHLSLRYEIQVPSRTAVAIKTGGGDINVSSLRGDAGLGTSGGSIKVSSIAGNLAAHTSGGDIDLRNVDGDAKIETSGGGIKAASLNGSLKAHTSGGDIDIEGVTDRVDAHTSGGSVRAAFARGNTRGGVLETSGGSIDVTLDPAANLNIEASTSGGSVTSDLPLTRGRVSSSSLSGSIGGGGELLRLHTSGGSVHIAAR